MAQVEMSLAQALVKKKTLEDRIKKQTDAIRSSNWTFLDIFVGQEKTGRVVKMTEEERKTDILSTYQSIITLIGNYENLCKAISLANNTTKVTIAGKEMVISEAIALKDSTLMKLKSSVYEKFDTDTRNVMKMFTKVYDIVNDEEAIKNYLNSVLPAEHTDEDVKKMEEQYHTMRDPRLFDPLHVKELGAQLEEEVVSFRDEVDYKLSEINATTKIVVEFED